MSAEQSGASQRSISSAEYDVPLGSHACSDLLAGRRPVNRGKGRTLTRQIEVSIANGKTTPLACKEAALTEQTYYRWRKEYGGLKVDQAKRLKDLEQENGKPKRLAAELSLNKQTLQDIARGNF